MSYLAQEWASETAPVADTYERIIVMKLASHADDDGRGAYPSIPSMARAALCDTETVKRRLRALLKRGLIALGDQALVAHYRSDRRPKVYDLLIPYTWYSADQIAKVNTECVQRGNAPLTPQDRPRLNPAPPRTKRADAGVPNANRRKAKPAAPTTGTTALQEPPPVHEDSPRAPDDGSPRAADGGSRSLAAGALAEPQISQSGTGHLETSQSGTAGVETPACLPVPSPQDQPRGDGGGVQDPQGAALLRGLRLTGKGGRVVTVSRQVITQHHQAVTELLRTWSPAGLAAHLTEGASGDKVENPLGLLVSVIRNTEPRPADDPAPAAPAITERPWCGRNGDDGQDPCDETSRTRLREDGRHYRCECHPLGTAPEQRQPAAHGTAAAPVAPGATLPPTAPAEPRPNRGGGPARAGSALAALGLDREQSSPGAPQTGVWGPPDPPTTTLDLDEAFEATA